MKLPKFIKASTHQERQQKLMTSNRQLMLTDTIFKLQPTKQSCLFRDILNESCKVNSNSEEWPQTPSTPLYQIKTNTNKLNDSVVLSKNLGTQNSGRYVKSAQPKRLQRNRLHVVKKPEQYEQRPNVLSLVSTPIKPFDSLMNSNGRKLNTDDLDRENCPSPKCQSKLETPIKQQSPSTNRFSFSKLTKFVSKSALKVMNRKSLGSSSSSPNTSSNSMQTDDEDQQPKQDNFKSNIYTSLEQQTAIENKINSIQKPSKPSRTCQPCMGITSLMIKHMKTKSHGLTAGISCYPNSYLVAMPIVFKNDHFKTDNYDKLVREPVPFISEDRASKKMTKPIVKSLSSIQSAFQSPKNSSPSSVSKVQIKSPILPSVNSCRISIYSSKSDNKLEKQLHFESFSEAVFLIFFLFF